MRIHKSGAVHMNSWNAITWGATTVLHLKAQLKNNRKSLTVDCTVASVTHLHTQPHSHHGCPPLRVYKGREGCPHEVGREPECNVL